MVEALETPGQAAAATPISEPAAASNNNDNATSSSPRRAKKPKTDKPSGEASATNDPSTTKRDSSAKKQPDQSQRQNRGRRQPNRQEDSLKQQAQKVYRAKGAGEDGADDQEKATEGTKRPQTQRNRRTAAADEATKDGAAGAAAGGEESKKGTGRAKSSRRQRDRSLAAVFDGDEVAADGEGSPKKRNPRNRRGNKDANGDASKEQQPAQGKNQGKQGGKEMTKEQKEKLALEKKREKMSNQYTPFASKRIFNSRFTEYQFAEWRRRRNNLFVTIETVVPEMPKKVLEEPDDAQYHLAVAKLDEQLEKVKEEFKDLVAEQHATRAIMKTGQLGKNPIRDTLRELFGELNIINADKKEKLGKMEVLNKKMMDVNRELDKYRKNVHPVYNDINKLDKGVKELEMTLQTNSWKPAEEKGLMREIEQVKSSRPIFVKIEEQRAKIAELKEQREAVKASLAPTNKIVNSLKERIGKVKGEESVYDKEKQLKQYDLTNVGTKIEKNFEEQRAIKTKKNELRETFYGLMCDYEVQQALIKDIEWISKTKDMAAERNERAQKYKAEQKARNDERKKMAEEREKQRAEIRAKNEERRLEQQAKQQEWELQQLSKLDENPYESQVDLCEQLIYFCAKNRKKTEEEGDGPTQEENKEVSAQSEAQDETRAKKLQEDVEKGKIEVAESKADRAAGNSLNQLQQQKNKKKRNRDGPSTFYYEEEDRVDLDYTTLQKFGGLEISPPTQIDQIETCNKKLVALRDALKLKGKIEQAEGKAKFSKDNSIVEAEDHVGAKAKYEELDAETKAAVEKIKSKIRFSRSNADDDEEYSRPQRNNRRGNDGGAQQRQGRGDGQQNRRRNRDLEIEEDNGGKQQAAAKKQQKKDNKPREKIAGNVDAFPELGEERKD